MVALCEVVEQEVVESYEVDQDVAEAFEPIVPGTLWRDIAYAELQVDKHRGIMTRVANWIGRRIPRNYRDPDELYCEVSDWAVEAAQRYDGTRSKFVTFLTHHLRMRARNYLRTVRSDKFYHLCYNSTRPVRLGSGEELSIDELVELPDETGFETRFDEFFDRLSTEARLVLLLVLENKEKLAKLGRYFPPRLSVIAKYLELSPVAMKRLTDEIQSVYRECV